MRAISDALRRLWRTWLFLLLTFIGTHRLHAAESSRLGVATLAVIRRLLAGGFIDVRAGAARGIRISTDWLPIDQIQGAGIVRGVVEPEVQEALRRHVRPGSIVFDVGANIGFFSLLGARLTGPTGRVVAFEPVPLNAAAVRANASLNRFDNVTVVEAAVSDENGPGTLCLPSELGWSHLTSRRGQHPDTQTEISVSLIALDDEIERGNLPVPDVIKIDVEDNEKEALTGLKRTLKAHDVVVICELHASNLAVLQIAQELDYAVTNLEGTEDVATAGPVHVLLYKKERS